ncbi:hypothetical protein F5X98DRAFT_56304 [Xylaria grammica]|nr:hypothetical protein F5X98DRAFT_56304 [Xylaria grammica]
MRVKKADSCLLSWPCIVRHLLLTISLAVPLSGCLSVCLSSIPFYYSLQIHSGSIESRCFPLDFALADGPKRDDGCDERSRTLLPAIRSTQSTSSTHQSILSLLLFFFLFFFLPTHRNGHLQAF